jgi:hypothetical protein
VAEGSLRKAPLTSRVERVGPFIDNQQMIARKAEDDLKWQDFLRDEIKRLLTAFYWLNGGLVFLVLLLWLGQIKLSPVHCGSHNHREGRARFDRRVGSAAWGACIWGRHGCR